jgi:phosphoribosylanthranilate isomerase
MFGEPSGANDRVRVKICGVTNLADALAAIECGADALGFNFFPGSQRYIEARWEADWMAQLPTKVCKVAVLVNPTWAEAMTAAAWPFIDALQLHGNESPLFCRRLAESGISFVKGWPVSDPAFASEIPDFFTDTVLLDSGSSGGFGGSGETFPWSLGSRFVQGHPNLKVILAGGLRPDNAAEAVAAVRPYGVDVTTGVEASPGRKDLRRLRAFFAAVSPR